MRIQRTIPPSVAPISFMELMRGFQGIVRKRSVSELEEEIKEYFGSKYAFSVSSGKAALFLILLALKKLTGKNKVIIPAYTCFSVPSAIRMAGMEIVLCDVLPDTLGFDFDDLRSLVDDDTLCVVATHLFGIPADVGEIREICRKRKVFIVDDAAQAMGAEFNQMKSGTGGDVGFFSFGRGKNITCGSGGMIITSTEEIADSLRKQLSAIRRVPTSVYLQHIVEVLFIAIFVHPVLYWFPKSLPFLKIGETRFYTTFPVHPLTGFQAGLLSRWQRKLERYNQIRSTTAELYLKDLDISNNVPIYGNKVPYLRFPMFMADKKSKERLCESGDRLGISAGYPCSINKIRDLKGYFERSGYEGAERIADTLVSLPTHILLIDEDKMAIMDLVRRCHEEFRETNRTVQRRETLFKAG